MTGRLFQENKALQQLSTFQIGGNATYFLEVKTIADLQSIVSRCYQDKMRYMILGKGSNTLFDDRGFNGLVILNKIDFLEKLPDGVFHVGAGYSFSLLGTQTARQGWSGLEFASGIPGSVGGAVYMNAGANGTETCETLVSVDYITETGELKRLNKEELHFAYRHSSFQEWKGAIAGATFTLLPSATARKKQIEIIGYRTKTQPYCDPSAGCIFRNPQSTPAGALIDRLGLKGLQVGGAKVSETHANFIVNAGNATCADVKALIQIIQEKVKQETGIELESEVRLIPYEDT